MADNAENGPIEKPPLLRKRSPWAEVPSFPERPPELAQGTERWEAQRVELAKIFDTSVPAGQPIRIPQNINPMLVDQMGRERANERNEAVLTENSSGTIVEYMPDSRSKNEIAREGFRLSELAGGKAVQVKSQGVTLYAENKRWDEEIKTLPEEFRARQREAQFEHLYGTEFNLSRYSAHVMGAASSSTEAELNRSEYTLSSSLFERRLAPDEAGFRLSQLARAKGHPITVSKIAADGRVMGTMSVDPGDHTSLDFGFLQRTWDNLGIAGAAKTSPPDRSPWTPSEDLARRMLHPLELSDSGLTGGISSDNTTPNLSYRRWLFKGAAGALAAGTVYELWRRSHGRNSVEESPPALIEPK